MREKSSASANEIAHLRPFTFKTGCL